MVSPHNFLDAKGRLGKLFRLLYFVPQPSMMPEAVPSEEQQKRVAGVLLPVFAIRTENDLGIGDVASVREMVDWLSTMGMRFLQVLPINETGRDNSPYNAISSVALEPALLDCSPDSLAELTPAEFEGGLREVDIDALRRGDVDYPEVKRLKLDLLWRAFDHFWNEHYRNGTDRDRGFHDFCESEQEWLGDYCLFRLLMDMEGGSEQWDKWSEDYAEVEKARAFVDALLEIRMEETEKQLAYYAYVQWVAFGQWKDLKAYATGKGVDLMGDIPFGVSYYSADVFCQTDLFDLEWSGGAPPEKVFKADPFTEKWGQNWGIPLYRWDEMEKDDFAWWRLRVGRVCEMFSMFRIDHALGFYRIYAFPWRPEQNEAFLPLSEDEARERADGRLPGFMPQPDHTDEQKQSNRAAGERYLRMIQEAAGDAHIIAEDLGMVPDYVRPSLEELRIAGMKVPHWEPDHDDGRLRMGDDYPPISLATYATHDHAPLKTQWNEWRATDAHDNLRRLGEFAGLDDCMRGSAYNDTIREALLRALFETKSRYASVMITDVLGLEDRFNVPGVVGDHNWTHRLEESVKDLVKSPHWNYVCARACRLLEDSERCPQPDGQETEQGFTFSH